MLQNKKTSIFVLFLAMLVMLPACTTNKATGRSQPNVLSPKDEARIGEAVAPKMVQSFGGELPQPEVRAYVTNLGEDLAKVSEEPQLDWKFYVLNSEVVNAFALPGGKIFITRGLLEKLQNEAQLAGVLGHEIGHVTARHMNDRLAQHLTVTLIGAGLGIAGSTTDNDALIYSGIGTAVGGNLTILAFSREHELEADRLGLRYMTRLGFNPVAQVQVMEILKRASQGGADIEFLQTHPVPNTRIKELNAYIRKNYPEYDNPKVYRFNTIGFERDVLNKLKELPPLSDTNN